MTNESPFSWNVIQPPSKLKILNLQRPTVVSNSNTELERGRQVNPPRRWWRKPTWPHLVEYLSHFRNILSPTRIVCLAPARAPTVMCYGLVCTHTYTIIIAISWKPKWLQCLYFWWRAHLIYKFNNTFGNMKRTLTCEDNTTPGPTTRIGLHTLLKLYRGNA